MKTKDPYQRSLLCDTEPQPLWSILHLWHHVINPQMTSGSQHPLLHLNLQGGNCLLALPRHSGFYNQCHKSEFIVMLENEECYFFFFFIGKWSQIPYHILSLHLSIYKVWMEKLSLCPCETFLPGMKITYLVTLWVTRLQQSRLYVAVP